MKFITREQALLRLDNPDNLFNIIKKNDFSSRGNGNNDYGRAGKFTPAEREMIVSLSNDLHNTEVANIVGCSPQTVSEFKRGVTSHDRNLNTPSSTIKQGIVETNREKASEVAAEKMLKSLNLIDDYKLKVCTATELATVAARLSTIGGKNGNNGGSKINVNINVPHIRNESMFESIEIGASVD